MTPICLNNSSIEGAVKCVSLSARMHCGVPYLRITSSVANRAMVEALQSWTALVKTNLQRPSVNTIMYRFLLFAVGVISPWKSIVSICHTSSGGFSR